MSTERKKIRFYSLAIWASGAIVGQAVWLWPDLGGGWGLGRIFFAGSILLSLPGLLLLPLGISYIDRRDWTLLSKRVATAGWASTYPLVVFLLRYLTERDWWWVKTGLMYMGFQAIAVFVFPWPGNKPGGGGDLKDRDAARTRERRRIKEIN